MCDPDAPNPPDFRDYIENWRTPMPLRDKLAYTRNNLLKRLRGTACCGNHGQPGC